MWTQEDFSKRIRDQLYALDPEISAELGTPERKIIDSVAQALSEAQFQGFLTDYTFDIDTKFGQDLDDMVQLFGFSRQMGRRAVGEVTFSRNEINGAAIFIPAATRVSTVADATNPVISFYTAVDATMAENQTQAKVAIEAILGGGSGNVQSNKIITLSSSVPNISSVTNYDATYAGANSESDEELKLRFKNNIFRNIAGIEDQFLALSIANQYTSRATILRASNKFKEYLTLDSAGNAVSQNRRAKHVYDFNYYLSDRADNRTYFFSPTGDYTFSVIEDGNIEYPEINVINMENNPSPSGTVSLRPIEDDINGNLVGDYQYATTYSYNPGGESVLSPVSGTASLSQGSVVVSGINNSSGTSSAGGTVEYKNVYRKDILFDNTWYRVGRLAPENTYDVTAVERDSNNVVTITLGGGSASTDGLSLSGTVDVSGLAGIGTALDGTYDIYTMGSSTISYLSTGSSFTQTAATGTAVSIPTVFNDNLTLADFIEPPFSSLYDGKVLFLEHEYISQWSRNIISPGKYSNLNKIDVYTSGLAIEKATDVIAGYGNILVNTPNNLYYNQYYIREQTHEYCQVGNYLVVLTWGPVTSIPEQVTIGGVTYFIDVDYWLAKDVSNIRESERAKDGIELSAAMASAIANTVYSVEYYFNKIPLLTNRIIDAHKQVNQDVLVHSANFRSFIVNLEVIYQNNFGPETVNPQIFLELSTFFNSLGFGSQIIFSDIEALVYDVAGVSNARIAMADDSAGTGYSQYYGIQEVLPDGTIKQTFVDDFVLDEIDLPVLYSLGPVDGTKPIQRTKSNWI